VTTDEFIIVTAKWNDTSASLAAKYLKDPSKDWVIAEFNEAETFKPGQKVIIPLIPLKRGGLKVNGYQTAPVLAYHAFSKKKTDKMVLREDAFEEQMSFLKNNGYRTITLDQLLDFLNIKGQAPQKSVAITIDDGWCSAYEIAYPIMKKYGFTATFFISSDFIHNKKCLNWEQVKEMSENGFDIECHTNSHRDLTKIEENSYGEYFNNIKKELSASKQLIQEKLNKECKYLAYPYGATNKLIIALLKKLNYQGAFTVNRGSNASFVNNFMINRSVIYGEYSLEDFKKNLSIFQQGN
jgi:peptidoglycan/xylan/chitin deacetylase (PgdA/CDA1 family)